MKIVETFKEIKPRYYSLILALSIVVTWVATSLAVLDYISRTGGVVDELGGYFKVAMSTLDITVLLFSVGLYLVAGFLTFISLAMFSRLQNASIAIPVWILLIITGVALAKVFS